MRVKCVSWWNNKHYTFQMEVPVCHPNISYWTLHGLWYACVWLSIRKEKCVLHVSACQISDYLVRNTFPVCKCLLLQHINMYTMIICAWKSSEGMYYTFTTDLFRKVARGSTSRRAVFWGRNATHGKQLFEKSLLPCCKICFYRLSQFVFLSLLPSFSVCESFYCPGQIKGLTAIHPGISTLLK